MDFSHLDDDTPPHTEPAMLADIAASASRRQRIRRSAFASVTAVCTFAIGIGVVSAINEPTRNQRVAILGSKGSPSTTTTTSEATSTTALDPNALTVALRKLGVDLDTAPAAGTDIGDANFCGYEIRTIGPISRDLNTNARRCFLASLKQPQVSVFVMSQSTPEGDPIVTIYRSTPYGGVNIYVDATRDKFGSGKWESATCKGVTTEFPDAPESLAHYYFEAHQCAWT